MRRWHYQVSGIMAALAMMGFGPAAAQQDAAPPVEAQIDNDEEQLD